MKIHRFVVSLLAPLAFSLAPAGQADAAGACVYVKQEAFQCLDRVKSQSACRSKSPSGEFHAATSCKGIGYGVTWGMLTAPAPPAKPSFQGVSHSVSEVPAIRSPFSGKSGDRKLRF
jgi:hypothetical protein